MSLTDASLAATILSQITAINTAITNAVAGIASWSANGKSVTRVPVSTLIAERRKLVIEYRRLTGSVPRFARGVVTGVGGAC